MTKFQELRDQTHRLAYFANMVDFTTNQIDEFTAMQETNSFVENEIIYQRLINIAEKQLKFYKIKLNEIVKNIAKIEMPKGIKGLSCNKITKGRI